MKTNLRNSRDFQRVYKAGKRYESSLIIVFALPNEYDYHRFGVTASKKAIGNAVQRNRAKRLMREAFRLTQSSLDGLRIKYDWVLNGRRTLLLSGLSEPLDDFRKIVGAVASEEGS